MRIPPSVIVMSVLTAVPFAMGIGDTLTQSDVDADDEYGDGLDLDGRRSARERRAELEAYEAELRREAMEREQRAKERVTKLDQLYGTKVASMGTLLDGIALGANAGSFQPEHVRARIERESRDGFLNVGFGVDATALNAVNVYVTSDYDDYETSDPCEALSEKLTAAWGRSTNGTWLDPTTHQRATLDLEPCRLTFDRYLEPADWVAGLPLAAIGSNAERFAEQLGPSANVDYDRVFWTMSGIGYGERDTQLEAYIEKNRIIGVTATVASDFDSTVAVRDALSAKLGAQPKRDEDTGLWTWKRRVPVVLEQQQSDRFTVRVGKMPWD